MVEAMSRHVKAVFVADLNPYSKGSVRFATLSGLGIEAVPVSHTQIGDEEQGCPRFSLAYRVAHRLGWHLDTERAGARMVAAVRAAAPELLWIEKGTMIAPAAIAAARRACPGMRVYAYSDDDMFLRHNRSRAFVRTLPLYDRVYTTKADNLRPEELPALGARAVARVDKAFDPERHFPMPVSEAERAELGAEVGFIGTYERNRAEAMHHLAVNGVPVRVWGNGWEACPFRHPDLRIERRAVVNTAARARYTLSICATRINLGFLRKLNRDTHTDRSVEIPACGGFMLAERSDDHRRLFEEGREAEFFGSREELLAKVRHYLAHEELRAPIAAAGRARCVRDDYSHAARMRFMLADLVG